MIHRIPESGKLPRVLVRAARDLLEPERKAPIVALVPGGDGVEEEPEGIRTGDDGFVDEGGEDVELRAAEPGVGHRAPAAVLARVRDDQKVVGAEEKDKTDFQCFKIICLVCLNALFLTVTQRLQWL